MINKLRYQYGYGQQWPQRRGNATSVIDLPPRKPATINEVAAIEFEPLPADTPVPEGFDDIEFALRLAHAIASKSKDELAAGMRQGGPEMAQEALDILDAAEGRLAAFVELARAAQARIMIAMGVVATGAD